MNTGITIALPYNTHYTEMNPHKNAAEKVSRLTISTNNNEFVLYF